MVQHQFRWVLILVVALGLFQSLIYSYTIKANPDQMQLFSKGVLLSETGKWTHHGNVVTGGGAVPGSLSTAVVGIPLWLWDNPWSYDLLIVLLHLIGLLLFWRSLTDELSHTEKIATICIVWLSPWRASFSFLWNPCYLFFISALHLRTTIRLSKQPTFVASFFHVLSMGIAFQIHASFILLIMSSAYLFMRRLVRFNWWGVASALVVTALSLLPYFISTLSDPNLVPVVAGQREEQYFYFRGLLEVGPLIKGVFYWVRYTSALFPSHIFSLIDFDFVQNPQIRSFLDLSFRSVTYLVASLSLVFSGAAFIWFIRRAWQLQPQKFLFHSFYDNYAFAMLLASVFACAVSPIMFSHWHLLLLMPIANIQFVRFVFHEMPNWRYLQRVKPIRLVASLCVYFAIYNFVAPVVSTNRSFVDNMHTNFEQLKRNFVSEP